MGYRPHLIKEYKCEYGNTLSGFNYGYEKFSEFLDELGICYHEDEGNTMHEVRIKDLLRVEKNLNGLHLSEEELDNLKDLIDVAKNSNYTKNYECVKVEWF